MTKYNKLWIALIMGIVQYVHIAYDIDLGIDQDTATAIVGGIGAWLVFRVPNK